MKLEMRVIKNHRHTVCPICHEGQHPFLARIFIEVEVDICNDCFYLRKEAFWYLRDHVDQMVVGDLRNLGILPPAQN